MGVQMKWFFPALFLAASQSPQPSPLPDASPLVRGAVSTGPQQYKGPKTDSDVHTVIADAGAAYVSSCVVNTAALGACPKGNGIQCVLDAGWYACQADAGWAPISATGVSSVGGSGSITSTGGATPTIACVAASNVVGGCLTPDFQQIVGYKELITGGQSDLLWSNQSATPRAVGSTTQSVSELNVHGAQFGGPICSLNDQQSLQFINSQAGNSVTPGEIHYSAYSRDGGGGYYAWNSGANCGGGIGTTMVGIGPEGTLYLAAAPDPVSCATRADVLTAAGIKEATCASGRQFVQSCDENYLAVSGDLGSATLGLTEDGGHPVPDGGPYVVLCGSNGGGGTDGGYCYAYLGAHAGLTAISRHAQVGAWTLGVENDNGVATAQKWHVGAEGGMGNEHGLTLGNFPPCPAVGVVSYYGGAYYQYAYGAAEGELLYASDQHRYYMCSNADSWVKVCIHLPDGGC